MTGEMIERVAKGIFERSPAHMSASGKVRYEWETLGDQSKMSWRRSAIAAIEVMREPTEAMVDSGKNILINDDSEAVARAFRAMIDAGLATTI